MRWEAPSSCPHPGLTALSSDLPSDHDDRWETKEAVSPAPEAPQPTPLEETPTQVRWPHLWAGVGVLRALPSPPIALCSPQLPETPAPAPQPPEDQGEEDQGQEDQGEEDEGEDEEWEDVSEDEEDIEEEEEEAEEEEEEEEEPTPDHQPQEPEPAGSPGSKQASKEPSRPEERPPVPQAPATPSSPFSPPGGHQPVSDWGEEVELNSPGATHPADARSPGEAWPFGYA